MNNAICDLTCDNVIILLDALGVWYVRNLGLEGKIAKNFKNGFEESISVRKLF